MIFFWSMAAIVLLLSFFYPKSKTIAMMQLTVIWILMGWNAGGIDFHENENIYYESGKQMFSGFGAGWLSNGIAYYFHQNGWNFICYNIFTTLIVLIIFIQILFRETKAPCMAINLFLIYPFLDCVMQKRYFLGMIFLVLGISFLKEKRKFLYLCCVLLAIGFHFSFLIFVPMVFVDLLDKNKEKMLIAFMITMEYVILQYGETVLRTLFNSAKVSRYIYEKHYSSIIVGIIYAGALFGYIYIVNKLLSFLGKSKRTNFLRKLNRFALILVPMCLFEAVYLRYYRIILLWVYIIISDESEFLLLGQGVIRVNKKNAWIWTFVGYSVILNFAIYYTSAYGIEGFVDTILQNNVLAALSVR